VAYVESQQYVKAETPLKAAIAEGAREKDQVFCWFSDFWLGVAREKQEDYQDALRYFRQALKEDGVSQEVRERSTEHIAAILREHPELK
jgi:TolA-binding protein